MNMDKIANVDSLKQIQHVYVFHSNTAMGLGNAVNQVIRAAVYIDISQASIDLAKTIDARFQTA